jgi:hypothetical protein
MLKKFRIDEGIDLPATQLARLFLHLDPSAPSHPQLSQHIPKDICYAR